MINKFILSIMLLSLMQLPDSPKVYSLEGDFPEMVVITERFKPYNYVENGELKGISVDLLELILKKTGSVQTRSSFKIMEWPRAYGLVQHTPMSLLFSTTRTKGRDYLFKWVGPIDVNITEMFARKSAHIKIDTIGDLKKYRIGTIINDAGELELISAGIPIVSLYRVVSRDQIRKLLYTGRIDLTPDNKKGFLDYAKKAGYNPDDYESVFTVSRSELYYALNKDTPDWIVEELQKALDSIKAEGLYQEILDKYRNNQ